MRRRWKPWLICVSFFFQAEGGIRGKLVTGVQTCALPISDAKRGRLAMSRTRVGVIGCGYWGPNLVRTFLEIPDATVVAVADRDPTRLEFLQIRYQIGRASCRERV